MLKYSRYKRGLRNNLSQIYAIALKDLKLNIRFKTILIFGLITPLVSILMPLIIFREFFNFNAEFGPWNEGNFLVFTFMAYNIMLLQKLISEFPAQLGREKYWNTLPALMIAPFSRINLLFGIFLGNIILNSIPFIIFFVLCYIFYPISLLTLFGVILIFFIIALIFSGIGLILGGFMISREGVYYFFKFGLTFVFWLSCISYPFEIFPELIQNVIHLNPLFYVLEIVRLVWIEDNLIISFINHSFHFVILINCAYLLPLIGILFFNRIFKKYGIVGF